jgi:hypothetical protein
MTKIQNFTLVETKNPTCTYNRIISSVHISFFLGIVQDKGFDYSEFLKPVLVYSLE